MWPHEDQTWCQRPAELSMSCPPRVTAEPGHQRSVRFSHLPKMVPKTNAHGWFDLDWFGLIWIDLDWFGLIWFDLDWFGLIWIDLNWFGGCTMMYQIFTLSAVAFVLDLLASRQFPCPNAQLSSTFDFIRSNIVVSAVLFFKTLACFPWHSTCRWPVEFTHTVTWIVQYHCHWCWHHLWRQPCKYKSIWHHVSVLSDVQAWSVNEK